MERMLVYLRKRKSEEHKKRILRCLQIRKNGRKALIDRKPQPKPPLPAVGGKGRKRKSGGPAVKGDGEQTGKGRLGRNYKTRTLLRGKAKGHPRSVSRQRNF